MNSLLKTKTGERLFKLINSLSMTYVKGDILINELPATLYELLSLRTAFIARVASYIYCTNYKFLSAYKLRVTVTFIARITIFFLHTSYELLLVARVTS